MIKDSSDDFHHRNHQGCDCFAIGNGFEFRTATTTSSLMCRAERSRYKLQFPEGRPRSSSQTFLPNLSLSIHDHTSVEEQYLLHLSEYSVLICRLCKKHDWIWSRGSATLPRGHTQGLGLNFLRRALRSVQCVPHGLEEIGRISRRHRWQGSIISCYKMSASHDETLGDHPLRSISYYDNPPKSPLVSMLSKHTDSKL
jgi:hypothetical protein